MKKILMLNDWNSQLTETGLAKANPERAKAFQGLNAARDVNGRDTKTRKPILPKNRRHCPQGLPRITL